jgi:hypothetical protein
MALALAGVFACHRDGAPGAAHAVAAPGDAGAAVRDAATVALREVSEAPGSAHPMGATSDAGAETRDAAPVEMGNRTGAPGLGEVNAGAPGVAYEATDGSVYESWNWRGNYFEAHVAAVVASAVHDLGCDRSSVRPDYMGIGYGSEDSLEGCGERVIYQFEDFTPTAQPGRVAQVKTGFRCVLVKRLPSESNLKKLAALTFMKSLKAGDGCEPTVRESGEGLYEVTGCNSPNAIYACYRNAQPLKFIRTVPPRETSEKRREQCDPTSLCTEPECDSFERAARNSFVRDRACALGRVSAIAHAPAWVWKQQQLASHTLVTAAGCGSETIYDCTGDGPGTHVPAKCVATHTKQSAQDNTGP